MPHQAPTGPEIPRPLPVFLGYGFKRLLPRPESLALPGVLHVASVSTCIAKRPRDWEQRWDFNGAGYYNDIAGAETAFADQQQGGECRDDFALFAYELYPMRFDRFGGSTTIDPTEVIDVNFGGLPASPVESELEFLGYDPVQRWSEPHPGRAESGALGGGFGCSALSCNGLATSRAVNAYCLIDDWNSAVATAIEAASSGTCEPGCYYLFGVYLRKSC